jgi:hypothetical protein
MCETYRQVDGEYNSLCFTQHHYNVSVIFIAYLMWDDSRGDRQLISYVRKCWS